MSTRNCCHIGTRAGEDIRRPATRLSRGRELAGWILPSATLALLPKCPACVAAYVALATGLGISVSTATYLRTTAVLSSVALLAFLTARRLRTISVRRKARQ